MTQATKTYYMTLGRLKTGQSRVHDMNNEMSSGHFKTDQIEPYNIEWQANDKLSLMIKMNKLSIKSDQHCWSVQYLRCVHCILAIDSGVELPAIPLEKIRVD